jgi:succinyl-CoA synthetase alpha subunit
MPILVDRKSRVLIQGAEKDIVSLMHQLCAYGTNVVAYVDAGRRGSPLLHLPCFESVAKARKHSSANVSLVFSSVERAADAILEAEDAGIPLIICYTAALPLQDMVEVQRVIRRNKRSVLIGPGSYGIITPGQSKVGYMPGYMYTAGSVGIVSRFGSLMDEVASRLSFVGQSTCVHVGEYPFFCSSIEDVIALFEKDEQTESILVIGEGTDFLALRKGKKNIFGLSIGVEKNDPPTARGGSAAFQIPVYDAIAALPIF